MLPALDLAILITAPLSVCLERATRRGLPIRLRDKEARIVDTFMQQSGRIMEIAAEYLATSERAALEIDNGGQLDSGVSSFLHDIQAFLQGRSKVDARATEPVALSATLGGSG
jgi:hypothetical protein